MTNNRIKVLTPEVFNKIAAGEVVERPASALKELVENSIDAGANRIVIEIKNAGMDLISVTDNGCGIYEEDLEGVFTRHATSKLEKPDDLNSIQTLGFRGEAISSIAAVARIKLTTRQAQSDTAVCVVVDNGEIISKEYVTANVGTKIEVTDMYYNIPARKKFLKTLNGEAVENTKFVSKLILTNPNLEMKYVVNDKTVYQTKGTGLSEAIFAVYGAECLANCIPVNFESEYLRIVGYTSNPTYDKHNTTYQTLSVNGRCVTDKNIQYAIMQAYSSFLVGKKYPMYVLDLSIPCDLVDVNVHPRKAEVRFENHAHVAGCFNRAVSKSLHEYTQATSKDLYGVSEKEQRFIKEDDSEDLFRHDDVPQDVSEPENQEVDFSRIGEFSDKKQSLKEFADELERLVTVESAKRALGLEQPQQVRTPMPEVRREEVQIPLTLIDDLDEENGTEASDADTFLNKAKVLGTAFKTYVIVELEDKLIFIDQHAAHERILYDKFMAGKSSDMQPVMFPYVFTVNDNEADFIERNIPNILRAGVEVEAFGQNTFRITAVSTLLEDTDMADFISFLLSEAEELEIDDRTLIVEKIAQKACKAAVKAGYILNSIEISFILKSIYENKILQCPHGRPIAVVYTRTQFEKMFKRIVG